MLNVNSIDAEIKELLDAEFEPFLNAVEFLTFFSKISDYTYSQLSLLMDRKIEDKKRNIRAITINDFEDYGFFDKNKLFKVMNSFSDISGFSFSVMPSIAFLAHTEEDNIFISVNDLKEIDENLIDAYPKSRLFYIHKSRLEKNHFVNLTEDRELKALREENTKQSNEIARLQAEIAELKAQPPQAVENIERYNSRERNTHLQIIGGLVEQLSKTGSKFRKKDNPNYYAIADTIASVTADYENATKAETIRRRLAEAYKALTSEN